MFTCDIPAIVDMSLSFCIVTTVFERLFILSVMPAKESALLFSVPLVASSQDLYLILA
jgi:hypothetical protein